MKIFNLEILVLEDILINSYNRVLVVDVGDDIIV